MTDVFRSVSPEKYTARLFGKPRSNLLCKLHRSSLFLRMTASPAAHPSGILQIIQKSRKTVPKYYSNFRWKCQASENPGRIFVHLVKFGKNGEIAWIFRCFPTISAHFHGFSRKKILWKHMEVTDCASCRRRNERVFEPFHGKIHAKNPVCPLTNRMETGIIKIERAYQQTVAPMIENSKRNNRFLVW